MRVLIAVEDERFGGACAEFVREHVWQPGTLFKIVHAVEPVFVGDRITAVYGADLENQILEDRLKYGRDLVARVKEQLEQELPAGMAVETNVISGRPHHVILETADIWQADTIVMGSHGRSGFNRFLMGSVSLSVLSHANCSVAIVKLPDQTNHEQKGSANTTNEKDAKAGDKVVVQKR